MKRLFFIILAVLLVGCLPSTENNPDTTSPLPEKKVKRSPKKFNKQPQLPEELKLTSVLYELAAASDPVNFANEHNIFLSKKRVRVYISFNPDSSISKREKVLENYNILVEKKAGNLSRALVPINRLIPLAKESVIWSIKLPNRLIKP